MTPGRSRETIEAALPLVVIFLLFVFAFLTLQPFIPALLWGIFLSVSLLPMNERLVARLGGRRTMASLGMGLLLTLVMVLPIAGLARAIVAFIPVALEWLSTATTSAAGGSSAEATATVGFAEAELDSVWQELARDLDYIRQRLGANVQPIANWLMTEGRLVGTFVLEFALGVLIACLLLRSAPSVGGSLRRFAQRVGGDYGTETLDHAVLTVRSTVLGILGSAAAQTAVASISYVVVGAPHWPILALLTFLLALLQIGAILIWAPLAIWLWTGGQEGMAIFLVVWGVVVVGLVDNLVKTAVVSRGANVPAILAFLGALGGLLTWGIVGIFLGPVIVAVSYQIILRWLTDDVSDPAE
jgi:predicted PurR-regulated permease PerM